MVPRVNNTTPPHQKIEGVVTLLGDEGTHIMGGMGGHGVVLRFKTQKGGDGDAGCVALIMGALRLLWFIQYHFFCRRVAYYSFCIGPATPTLPVVLIFRFSIACCNGNGLARYSCLLLLLTVRSSPAKKSSCGVTLQSERMEQQK